MRRRLPWGKARPAWAFDPGRRLDMASRQGPAEEPGRRREVVASVERDLDGDVDIVVVDGGRSERSGGRDVT